jgi:hypothetical protein
LRKTRSTSVIDDKMEGKGGRKISRKTAFYREIEAAFLERI